MIPLLLAVTLCAPPPMSAYNWCRYGGCETLSVQWRADDYPSADLAALALTNLQPAQKESAQIVAIPHDRAWLVLYRLTQAEVARNMADFSRGIIHIAPYGVIAVQTLDDVPAVVKNEHFREAKIDFAVVSTGDPIAPYLIVEHSFGPCPTTRGHAAPH